MIKYLKDWIHVVRLRQWVKNAFIIVPIVFAGKMMSADLMLLVLMAFFAFSYLTSATYIFNDFLDRKTDALHPSKSKHPFVQRQPHWVWVLLLVLSFLCGGLYILSLLGLTILGLGLAYLILQVIYNVIIKRLVILDVFVIAIGFQIRIWIGALVIGVTPSGWLQLCVLFLALFLGFAKRRQEMTLLQQQAGHFKHVLKYYRRYFLDQILIICGTLVVIFYGLYSLSPTAHWASETQMMVFSNVFVVYGVFRYVYLIHQKRPKSDPGDIVFSDLGLLLCLASWFVYVLGIIYFL